MLRGFQRVSLQAGEKKNVSISCPFEKLTWYNPMNERMELEHMEYEVYIGTSSHQKDLISGIVLI